MTAAAIKGNYADLKFIKTRGVVQIVIECPIEEGSAIVSAFGTPQPSAEIPVAVARLNEGTKPAIEQPAEPRGQRKLADLPYPQQAALLCDNDLFRRWLLETHGDSDPADLVRKACGVKSRAEILPGTYAEGHWLKMRSAYEAWKLAPSCGADPIKEAKAV